jgi:hypothetical protein
MSPREFEKKAGGLEDRVESPDLRAERADLSDEVLSDVPTLSDREIDSKLKKDKEFLKSLWSAEWLFQKYWKVNFLKSQVARDLKKKFPEKFASKYIPVFARRVAEKEAFRAGKEVYLHNVKAGRREWGYGFTMSYDHYLESLFASEVENADINDLLVQQIDRKEKVRRMENVKKISYSHSSLPNMGVDFRVDREVNWDGGGWLFDYMDDMFMMLDGDDFSDVLTDVQFPDFIGGKLNLRIERRFSGNRQSYFFTFQKKGGEVSRHEISFAFRAFPLGLSYLDKVKQTLRNVVRVEEERRMQEAPYLRDKRIREDVLEELGRDE